jgi:eukaryotic-like serine/threonine-protein kinase
VAATPGFKAAVYASDTVPNRVDQWRKVSGTTTVNRVQRIPLDTAGQRFRYYLLWISELPEGGQAAIKELSLKK